MRFKLDENLGRAAAGVLQAHAHDVQTVRGQGLSSAGDRDVIRACQSEQRCLVTLDLDFGNPLLFDPAEYTGIAVLRLPPRPSHQDIIDACQTLVAGLKQADITGNFGSCSVAGYASINPETGRRHTGWPVSPAAGPPVPGVSPHLDHLQLDAIDAADWRTLGEPDSA